eukprot:g6735.t1
MSILGAGISDHLRFGSSLAMNTGIAEQEERQQIGVDIAASASDHLHGLLPESPEYDTAYAAWLQLRFRTAVAWRKVRDAHRATWFAEEQCVNTAGVKAGYVTPRFFVSGGKPTPAQLAEQAEFGDMVFLSDFDGDLEQKQTPEQLPLMKADRRGVVNWFKLVAKAHSSNAFNFGGMSTTMAAAAHPTFIGKMDCDTFVSPCALLRDIADAGTPLYYGTMLGSKKQLEGLVAPKEKKTPALNIEQCEPSSGPYMQGGLYVLSVDLARWIVTHLDSTSPDIRMTKSEDVLVGCMMQNAVRAGATPIGAIHPVVWERDDDCNLKWCKAWNPFTGHFLFKHLYFRNVATGRAASEDPPLAHDHPFAYDVMTMSPAGPAAVRGAGFVGGARRVKPGVTTTEANLSGTEEQEVAKKVFWIEVILGMIVVVLVLIFIGRGVAAYFKSEAGGAARG